MSQPNAFKHGMWGHPVYRCWHHMKERCLKSNDPSWSNYGGRGIQICERWLEFNNFRDDMLSTWQLGLQLDRIDNDGNYTPENCRWSTRSQNSKNKQHKAEFQSSVDGVIWNKTKAVWQITYRFQTKEEAEDFANAVRSSE